MVRFALPALLVVACFGCEEDPPPTEDGSAFESFEPGPVALRRLTRVQYARVVRDLFGPDVVVPDLAEPDVAQGGLLSVGASDTSFSARGVESLEDGAFAIAEQALATPESIERLVPCAPDGIVDSDCSAAFVRTLGLRAWRRPLTDDEVARIAGIADTAAEALDDFHAGLHYAVAALLQSPFFVFRAELELDGYELAARLSFFLWNAAPDDTLLAAAASGTLATDEGLRAQARRLLGSRRAREGVRNYFTEQLGLYRLDRLHKDPTLFEHFNTQLGPDAREETLRVIERIVFDDDTDFREVMTTRDTFLNPRLASLYGVPAPVRGGFGDARLPADGGRGGLLTQASFLNLQSHAVSSSATLRGAFVREVLLCQEIPAPPVNVDTSIPEPTGEKVTLRDRVEEHMGSESCAGCHRLTDPIGLGLENFDGIGRWRTHEYGGRIDPSGDLDSVPFDDALMLGTVVRDHPAFAPCVVRTLVRYATGRPEIPEELPALETLSERFADSGYRVKSLLEEIVLSPLFRRAGTPR